MTHKFFSIAIIFFIAITGTALAQTGIIKGTIIDAKTNEPLIGASVLVEGTTSGAAADLDGNFVIQNVPAGTYNLIASYVAYQSVTKTGVVVERNKETIVEILMSSDDISLDEVEVVARANRESENILLLEQKKALLATQAVGASELSRKGIGNAQAAVTQVSGISKQEGVKNVFVRGLGDRYNSTLLNGFPIPSEDPEYKNISLDFFGTDIIQSIGVNKVFSSNNPSDVGGAIIDISSKELINDYELAVNLSGGVNSTAMGIDFLRQDGSNYFGFANTQQPTDNQYDFKNSFDPSTVSFPMNHSYGFSGGKLFKVDENNNPLSFFVVASHSTDYSYTDEQVRNTTTDGTIYQDQTGKKYSQDINQLLLGNLSFGLNKKHNLQYNFMLIHANNQYYGRYEGMNSERFQGAEEFGYLGVNIRQQTNDNLLLINQLISSWTLSKSLKLNTGISYNTITGNEPDRRESYFSLADGGYYNLTGSNRNKRFFSQLKNSDINPMVNLEYNLKDRFDSGNSSVTLGYTGRFIKDDFEALEYNLSRIGAMSPFLLEGLSIDKFFKDGITNGVIGMSTGKNETYNVSKNIHSVYLGFNYQLAKNLAANAGLSADFVDLTVDYDVAANGKGQVPLNKKYYLPSLNLKYDINDKNSLRLGVSKTYTLPQSKEISPFQYINISFTSQGNPYLQPSDNYNIDLKWDYYLTPGEIVSLTGFYKYIKSPIGRVDEGNSAGLLTYDNIGDHAIVSGIELELRKNLLNRVSTEFERVNKISMGLNASYIYTNLMLDILNTKPRNTGLEGASPFLANADISYNFNNKDKSFTASLIFNYFSDRIYTVGAREYKDIIENGIGRLDFAASYGFNRNLFLKFRATNILNPAYKLYRESSGSEGIVILDEYKKGQNISLGVSYEF